MGAFTFSMKQFYFVSGLLIQQQMSYIFENSIILLFIISTLSQSSPRQNIKNCLKYSHNGKCFTCIPPLILFENRCLRPEQKIMDFRPRSFQRILLTIANTEMVYVNSQQQLNNQKRSALYQFNSLGMISESACALNWNNTCIICNNGFEMSSNGQCIVRFEQCLSYDANFLCVKCHPNFKLKDGQCLDKGCQTNDYYHCSQCKNGLIINKYRYCQDKNCLAMEDGDCKQCLNNYILLNGVCSLNQLNNVSIIPNSTSFPNISTHCLQPTCQYCSSGYISINSKCQQLHNCLKVSGNMCLVCESTYSMTIEGTCIKTISGCVQYSIKECLQCATNYILIKNQTCQLNSTFVDTNCNVRNIKGDCILCKQKYKIFTQFNSLCMATSSLCKIIGKNGECLSCYEGYILNSAANDCIKVASIPNCAIQIEGECKKCAYRYYLVGDVACKEVDPQCRDYETESGRCSACYSGYQLINSTCKLLDLTNLNSQSSSNLSAAATSFCKQVYPTNPSKCLSCYSNYFISPSGKCTAVSPLCKTFNPTTGACLTCYEGYILSSRQCTPQILASSQLPIPNLQTFIIGCNKLDPIINQCLQCSNRYYKQNGICKQISMLCNQYDKNNGNCLGCFFGYILQNGKCIANSK